MATNTQLVPTSSALNLISNFEDSAPDSIVIRAISPDNMLSASKLVNLFKQCYGREYPVENVYEESFWFQDDIDIVSPHLVSIISLVATHNNEFVAHIGLRHSLDGQAVEIVHPAIHPDSRKDMFHIGRLFYEYVSTQAQRQNWRFIYLNTVLHQPAFQVLASKCFHSQEVAMMLALGNSPQTLFSVNIVSSANEPLSVVHLPERHKEFIEHLYQPLSLPRTFLRGAPSEHTGRRTAFRAPRVGETPLRTEQSGLGAQLTVIRPGLLGGMDEVRSTIKSTNSTLLMSLNDPLTPYASDWAEECGFRFTGIVPHLNGSDFIVYSKFTPETLRECSFYSAGAKELAQYLGIAH